MVERTIQEDNPGEVATLLLRCQTAIWPTETARDAETGLSVSKRLRGGGLADYHQETLRNCLSWAPLGFDGVRRAIRSRDPVESAWGRLYPQPELCGSLLRALDRVERESGGQ